MGLLSRLHRFHSASDLKSIGISLNSSNIARRFNFSREEKQVDADENLPFKKVKILDDEHN
jgi:hypothetical protein